MFRFGALGAVAVIGVTAYVIAGTDAVARPLVGDLAILVFAVCATVSCAWAAVRRRPGARGWALLALALLLWTCGQVVWTYFGITRDHVYPFPSLADALFLSYGVPAVLALLAFPHARTTVVPRMRVILDTIVIILGTFIVSWALILGADFASHGLGSLAAWTGLAYPLVDVAVFSTVLALGMRRPRGHRLPWLFLGCGLLLLATTDSVYVRLSFEGQTGLTAGPLVAGWMSAFLLIALAPLVPTRDVDGPPARDAVLGLEVIPYLPMLAALGVMFFTEVHDQPFLLATGVVMVVLASIRQVLVLFENVTLTRDLESKVRARTAELNRLGSIVTSSGDAIVGFSLDGRVTSWNPAAERLFGHARADVIDRRPEFLTAAQQRKLHRRLGDVAKGAELSPCQVDWQQADGTFVLVELTMSPIVDDGDVHGISIFAKDVTERQRAAVVLEHAREAALEASRLKSEFLATMSHEIRTPMNGVIGLTGLLLDTPLTQTQRQFAEGVRAAGEGLLEIINDVLDFSKLEAGKIELEDTDVDLRLLVEEVGSLMAPSAQAKGLELVAYALPELPSAIRGDPVRIRQVLLNLASNAVKFTGQGEVDIRARRSVGANGRSMVLFEVRDTGIGLSEQDQSRLFDAFVQADASTTRRFGGTGLGLAISRQLVEAMGGELGVTSAVGVGSRFWFSLPLVVGLKSDETDWSDLLTGVRAIVVDDNATNRLILETQFRSWRLEVDAFENAQSGLARMQAEARDGRPYDLAVLDMNMPGTDGLGLARSISADASLRGTPMMMLTSAPPATEEAMRAVGITQWLSKPVRSSELYDRLVRLMAPEAAERAPRATASGSRDGTSTEQDPDGRGRVLVVEDNSLNQLVAEGILTKLGYRADFAANGVEAIEAMRTGSYSLVLMDCHMPLMDGFEATREIRWREGTLRRTPIIAMTAAAMAEDRERCLAAGMDDVITKPVDPARIEKALVEWIAPTSADSSAGSVLPGPSLPTEHAALDPERMATLRELEAPGDSSLVSSLAAAFVSDGDRILSNLRVASRTGGEEDLRQAAHELKGASANVGARLVAALCGQLESRPDSATTDRLLDQLEQELERAKEALAAAVASSS